MKKFVIVSTYPESGSKNIGDQLITSCLKSLIIDNIPDADFSVVWRGDSWENIKDTVLASDHIFFACLAIRPRMHEKEYPYLYEILSSGIQFSIVAAGTDLPVARDIDIYKEFSKKSIQLLCEINHRAVAFTTRGALTQEFCRKNGLDRAIFAGDIAFYNKTYNNLTFEKDVNINKIVISDPHRAVAYMKPMGILIDELRNTFPGAKLLVALHGINKEVESLCELKDVGVAKIYEDRYSGLDIYEEADLHVGFRVHAHVSALKRKKYSYLLEQDGRGCDYGVTIENKISLPCYAASSPLFSLKNIIKLIVGRPRAAKQTVSISPVFQLMALIRNDFENGFEKFVGLEEQVKKFNKASEDALRPVLRSLDNHVAF